MKKNLTAFTRLTRLARLTCITILSLAATLSHAQVGMRKMVSGDMPITVTYPTASPSLPITNGPFTIHAAKDAEPLAAPPASRRLIVLSHGTAGSTDNDHDLAATLARAGFVVAQPLHRGDNFKDFSQAGPGSWRTRPGDVTETINALAQDPLLGPQLDLQHVGVHGMSAGGGTGIMMAGGQWRMWELVQHCAHHLDEDIGFCLNGLAAHPLKQALRKAQFAMSRLFLTEDNASASMKMLQGGQSPSQSQDSRPDPRITAVSVAVPLGVIFTPESLARIRIPALLLNAGKVLNLPLVGLWVQLLRIPKGLMTAIILVFSTVGAYSLQGSLGDVVIVWLLGVAAFLLRRFGFPIAPVLLGLVLGPMLEQDLRRSLVISSGDFGIFLTRPIAMAVFALIAALAVYRLASLLRARRAAKA